MRAGSMRERLTFLEEVETQTPSGAIKREWIEIYSCRAFYRKSSPVYDKDGVEARERFKGDNLYMIIRKNKKVHDLMRVRYNNTIYEVIPPIKPNHTDHTLEVQIRRLNEQH